MRKCRKGCHEAQPAEVDKFMRPEMVELFPRCGIVSISLVRNVRFGTLAILLPHSYPHWYVALSSSIVVHKKNLAAKISCAFLWDL